MIGGIYFAGAPFAGMLRLGAQAASLAASAVISFTSTATISRGPAYLAADAHIVWTAARADLRFPPVDTSAGIWIGGVNVTGRVRVQGVTIHDILNDAPNTASLVVEGAAPAVGQAVRILTGSRLLFAGMVQSIDESYKVDPDVPAWAITAIDDTGIANARRPFGVFVDVSATTIAQTITTTYAPGFSTAGIVAGLPPVRIVFDGGDTFISCLTRLATAIGGYCKIEDRTVYLFTDDTADPPYPIDPDHCFMHDPPIVMTTDSSQLRTRVYGKGYGEHVPTAINAGETLLPIENGTQFPAAGGRAIVGTTSDGAQSEQIAFTSVERLPGGTLVGTGAGPTTALGVSLAAGTGVEAGAHSYAQVFVTASGKSLPGPLAVITVGALAAPGTAPTAGTPTSSGGVTAGSHRYYAVFRTATGATTAGPVGNAVTVVGSTPPPGSHGTSGDNGDGGLGRELNYYYKSTFYRASDGAETEPGPSALLFTFGENWDVGIRTGGVQQLTPPAGFVQRVYRTNDGGPSGGVGVPYYRIVNLRSTSGYWIQADTALGGAPPTVNTTVKGTIPITGIPVAAGSLVTHVDLYREVNNAGAATARLALSVTNGTTTATDTTASLGALVPASNTATANRVAVTYAAGPAAVTNIEIYRTPVGSAQLKLWMAVGSNTAGTTTDGTPDASLGANAPVADTSGLQQPQGQVNPGAAVLPVASAAVFRSGGGWVTLAGDQVVRYTGVSAQSLTGIPATGSGAITTTVIFGTPALPTPMLLGVTGLTKAMQRGSAVHLWIQRDDLAAQAEHAARTGGDGIVEYLIVDMRRGLDSLTARVDADLALFSRPLVTVAYSTHDLKTKSGKQVLVNLPAPLNMLASLTIQDVTITKLDIVPYLPPLFTVKASSVRFSLEDTLRRLIAGGLTVGGST